MMSIAKLPIHISTPSPRNLALQSSVRCLVPSFRNTNSTKMFARRQKFLAVSCSVSGTPVQSTQQSENVAVPIMVFFPGISLICFAHFPATF